MKTKLGILLIGAVICGAAIYLLTTSGSPSESVRSEVKLVLNMEVPENEWEQVGTAMLTFSENDMTSYEIINEIFELPSQYSCHLENSTIENGKKIHLFRVYSNANEWLLEQGVPPIRQDNENINFCFYVRVRNIVIGNKPWWDYALGCDSLDFTLILPENYGLGEDVMSALRYGKLGYRDNQYSIFTSASSLEKMFADNRWRITARWEEGKFDRFNADLYLEVHYRKIQP
jgi:hypothetical protein